MDNTPSERGLSILSALHSAVDKAIDRKRRLGQYWVEWDGEKVVIMNPEVASNPADKKTA